MDPLSILFWMLALLFVLLFTGTGLSIIYLIKAWPEIKEELIKAVRR